MGAEIPAWRRLIGSGRQRALGWLPAGRWLVECSCCRWRGRSFAPFGDHRPLPNRRCPRCGSLERHRLLAVYLASRTDAFRGHAGVVHVAPEAALGARFRRVGARYVKVDLKMSGVDVRADLARLPFPEATFDLAICNHVLEFVEDDGVALAELRRVLRPGGRAICQSFVDYSVDATRDVSGPAGEGLELADDGHGAPARRIYGSDYPERLRAAGFVVHPDGFVRELPPRLVRLHVLDLAEDIWVCTR